MDSDSHQLHGTLAKGQPVGISSVQNFNLEAGFWNLISVPLAGDLNENGIVDASDLRIVVAAFNTSPPSDSRADVNGDGMVDIHDLVMVAGNFGRGSP